MRSAAGPGQTVRSAAGPGLVAAVSSTACPDLELTTAVDVRRVDVRDGDVADGGVVD